jgi:hypothetical protein
MDANTFCAEIDPLLKRQGFKKQRFNWRKDINSAIEIINVQKSPWGGGRYYVNLGVYLKALGQELKPTHNRCHVQGRLEIGEPATTVATALDWLSLRESIAALRKLHEAGRLTGKGLVFKEVLSAIADQPDIPSELSPQTAPVR